MPSTPELHRAWVCKDRHACEHGVDFGSKLPGELAPRWGCGCPCSTHIERTYGWYGWCVWTAPSTRPRHIELRGPSMYRHASPPYRCKQPHRAAVHSPAIQPWTAPLRADIQPHRIAVYGPARRARTAGALQGRGDTGTGTRGPYGASIGEMQQYILKRTSSLCVPCISTRSVNIDSGIETASAYRGSLPI